MQQFTTLKFNKGSGSISKNNMATSPQNVRRGNHVLSTDQTSGGEIYKMQKLNQGSNAEGVGVFGITLHNPNNLMNLQVTNNLHSVSSLALEEDQNPSRVATHHQNPLKI